jgi:hypothetical protein
MMVAMLLLLLLKKKTRLKMRMMWNGEDVFGVAMTVIYIY